MQNLTKSWQSPLRTGLGNSCAYRMSLPSSHGKNASILGPSLPWWDDNCCPTGPKNPLFWEWFLWIWRLRGELPSHPGAIMGPTQIYNNSYYYYYMCIYICFRECFDVDILVFFQVSSRVALKIFSQYLSNGGNSSAELRLPLSGW